MNEQRKSARFRRIRLSLAVLVLVFLPALPVLPAASAPPAPTGLTAFALPGGVALSWQPTTGAKSYQVFRSTTLGGAGTQVATPAGTTYKDTAVLNGSTYYYTVKAVSGSASPASAIAQATPRSSTCSTGNPVVVENCFPGTTAWKLAAKADAWSGGLDAFATKSSINRGESVDLKVKAGAWGHPYRIEIYRSGWYGDSQGRLVSVLPERLGAMQPTCGGDSADTGLVDCSNWSVTDTITTSADWTPGVYLLRLVRTDAGGDTHILLTVRDDSAARDVLYVLPTTTYQAYNAYGGKSTYDYNSMGSNTISGTKRAVKVSFDRPYDQGQRDWYTGEDVRILSWLERQGYDLGYTTSEHLHTGVPKLNSYKAIVSGAHDEYYSGPMRAALTNARGAGVGIAFLGANDIYWRVRYEPSPISGAADRVMVVYKTTESGPIDPSGPTGTWRDPLGANAPENALIGQQYFGQNVASYFPLVVSAAQGKHRIWRYTSLGALAVGTSQAVGQTLVGWEWDARAANGREPQGVNTVAASPVSGDILQDAGKTYAPGSAIQQSTYYKLSDTSGVIFAAGTNHWGRGLGLNANGIGEPNSIIMQATANALADMRAYPATPSKITVDGTSGPAVTSRTPAPDSSGFPTAGHVQATFAESPDPSTVNASSFTLEGPNNTSVPASVTFNVDTRTATLKPNAELSARTTYIATLTTAIENWNGQSLPSAVTWSFTTASGPPPTVVTRTPAPGATNVSVTTTATATFDRDIDPGTVTGTSFTLTPSGGTAVQASIGYDASTRTATLTPSAVLLSSTTYTARVSTAVKATDGATVAADVTWTFTTQSAPPPLTVTNRTPAPFSTEISTATNVRAVFSRSINPTSLTSATFNLVSDIGASVAATLSYDDATRTATLTPNAPLGTQVTYTATVTTGLKADDNTSLSKEVSWTFTTTFSSSPPPAVTDTSPLAGAKTVPAATVVRATFDRPIDRATLTAQSFTLTADGQPPVVATVSYDSVTNTAMLMPDAPLAMGTQYTAHVTTAVRSTLGAPLSTDVSWTFTTSQCPCQIFPSTLAPSDRGLASNDGHGFPTYELGVRFTVDAPVDVTTLRYYRDAAETGSHVGRLWDASGALLASAPYQNESGAGWQSQELGSPVTLQSGKVYIASVNVNAAWARTLSVMSNQFTSGPLSTVADGNNGVYGLKAGDFPTGSWGNSNYFVDVIVDDPNQATAVPRVVGQQPGNGNDGVDLATKVKAAFDVAVDASTLTSSSFTLSDPGGANVPASVTYDSSKRTATLTPNDVLDERTTYTARLATSVRSQAGVPLESPVQWSFTTEYQAAPRVVTTSPTGGSELVSPASVVRVTFSRAMNATTINSSTFTLHAAAGTAVPSSVSYSSTTKTAVLTPSAALKPSTDYTASVSTAIRDANGVELAVAAAWTFTTSACPCRLFSDAVFPAATQLPTQDRRSGPGPWSYELGVKFRVTTPATLTAVRFFKSFGETGTHVGRLWNANGTQLATATFTNEGGSGWQGQAFTAPVDLAPGQIYVLSVGFNSYFSMTEGALTHEIVDGPLRSLADGANGVYGHAVGVFPTQSWSNSSYLVDPVIK